MLSSAPRARFLIVACGLALLASHASAQVKWYPKALSDIAVYTKVKSNLVGQWQQETGLNVKLATLGRAGLNANVGWLFNYPFLTKFPPRWTAGATLSYRIAPDPLAISVYTKTKSDLKGHWQQETGLSKLLMRTKEWTLGTNLAYVAKIPSHSSDKPGWTWGLTFSVPLK